MLRIVALALILALAAAPVAAGDRGRHRTGPAADRPHAPRQRVIVQDRGLEVFGQRRITVVPMTPCRDSAGRWICARRSFPRHGFVVAPQTVVVVPSPACLVPGYWTYQWIPPAWYNVWVPGQWTPDGSAWIDGHYEAQPYGTGYYQPLWVPERWVC